MELRARARPLPDRGLSILSVAQEQLIVKQKNLRETKAMLVSLENQMSEMSDFQLDDSLWATENNFELTGDDSLNIEQLKEELSSLKLKYTDRHPDVIRIKDTITRLEEQAKEESGEDPSASVSEPAESDLAAELPEIGFQDLQEVQTEGTVLLWRS